MRTSLNKYKFYVIYIDGKFEVRYPDKEEAQQMYHAFCNHPWHINEEGEVIEYNSIEIKEEWL